MHDRAHTVPNLDHKGVAPVAASWAVTGLLRLLADQAVGYDLAPLLNWSAA
jgi:hypothetical protein